MKFTDCCLFITVGFNALNKFLPCVSKCWSRYLDEITAQTMHFVFGVWTIPYSESKPSLRAPKIKWVYCAWVVILCDYVFFRKFRAILRERTKITYGPPTHSFVCFEIFFPKFSFKIPSKHINLYKYILYTEKRKSCNFQNG